MSTSRMRPEEVVHFRLDPRLRVRIDNEVARQRAKGIPAHLANRSVVIRNVLMTVLEDPDGVDTYTVDSGLEVLSMALSRALAEVSANLPGIVHDHLQQIAAETANLRGAARPRGRNGARPPKPTAVVPSPDSAAKAG